MQFYSRPKRPLSINIVSMIDILSILLIFFIVTTTFKKAETKVEIILPESTTAKPGEHTVTPVTISVTRENRIFIDTEEVLLKNLSPRIAEIRKKTPNAIFTLEADEGIHLGFFVKIMDLAKEAGLNDLSLNTRKPQETP